MAAELAGAWTPESQHAWRGMLDAAIAKYPSDEEFLILRGFSESPDPAERGQGSVAASIPYYQKALAVAQRLEAVRLGVQGQPRAVVVGGELGAQRDPAADGLAASIWR